MRIVGGVSLLLFGLVITVIGLHGLLDPASAQLSADDDPFGTPPSWQFFVLFTGIGIVLVATGILLCFPKRRR